MALSSAPSAAATSTMSDTPKMYTIGDLARELDVSTRTIRYYEERGLLRPQRTTNTQQRLYTPGDRVRLKLLLRARGLGFRLEDIRELFEIYDATQRATSGPAAAPDDCRAAATGRGAAS